MICFLKLYLLNGYVKKRVLGTGYYQRSLFQFLLWADPGINYDLPVAVIADFDSCHNKSLPPPQKWSMGWAATAFDLGASGMLPPI
jgi:hypothetical protein